MTTFALDFSADYFALFGLARAQGIDAAALETRFRDIQAQVHPDKHAQGSEANQRLAMQWATRVNEAYQTLKSPLARARYLLQLQGHDAQVESNTSMPMEFLVAQMELREACQGFSAWRAGVPVSLKITPLTSWLCASRVQL